MPPSSRPLRHILPAACAAVVLLAACATPAPTAPTNAELVRQVADTERGFAKTMADRNLAGFATYLSADAIFFTASAPLRGKDAVVERWKRLYEKPEAPFSWAPDKVEVLDSGTLALSSGPVYDPGGKLVATFTSIWRLEAPGVWRIVFDKGNDVCDCKAP